MTNFDPNIIIDIVYGFLSSEDPQNKYGGHWAGINELLINPDVIRKLNLSISPNNDEIFYRTHLLKFSEEIKTNNNLWTSPDLVDS